MERWHRALHSSRRLNYCSFKNYQLQQEHDDVAAADAACKALAASLQRVCVFVHADQPGAIDQVTRISPLAIKCSAFSAGLRGVAAGSGLHI